MPLPYCGGVGTSFTGYRGSGFWTRDAALETVLALLVVELGPAACGDEALEQVLDAWTLQAVAGFTVFVRPVSTSTFRSGPAWPRRSPRR